MSAEDIQAQKDYEARLRRRLDILETEFKAGRVKLAPGVEGDTIESLKKIRRTSDGVVDLNTVDGHVRSLALAITAMHDREDLKTQLPLNKIQEAYFAFVENNFEFLYKEMIRHNTTPHQYAAFVSSREKLVLNLTKTMPGFLEAVEGFWNDAAEAVYAHVEDMRVLKGVFGGDLFPSHEQNIASKCGLYTDTIVLPDPFLRSKEIWSAVPKEKSIYYLVKHGLNILQYKDLACAELATPIVVVVPDITALEKEEKNYIFGLGKQDSLIHNGKLFGRRFSSFEEMMGYAAQLDTVEQVLKNIVDDGRVLFDVDWDRSASKQITMALNNENIPSTHRQSVGHLVASYSVSRMGISNELLIKAGRLGGIPIMDAPTSWQYLVWKLEYDADSAKDVLGAPDLHVVKGLQSLSENEMQWLGRIPLKALIEIRKSGAIDEIRSVLGKGVSDLASYNPQNFFRTADLVFDNIEQAFKAHRQSIAELSAKKWKFAGSDIGSWLVGGTLAVTAVATGQIVWGLAAIAADNLLDVPKLKDIPKSIKSLALESQRIKRSPVGILFDLAKEKT